MGFEGRAILQCKCTLTPELSDRPILNDLYKRIPTNICQKLRRPRSAQVFGGEFGKCVHFLETNYATGMQYLGDDLASRVKRTVVVIFPRKRRFARDTSEVGDESGVYLMRRAEEHMGESSNADNSESLFWLLGELLEGAPCRQAREYAREPRVCRSGFRAHPLTGNRGILKDNSVTA